MRGVGVRTRIVYRPRRCTMFIERENFLQFQRQKGFRFCPSVVYWNYCQRILYLFFNFFVFFFDTPRWAYIYTYFRTIATNSQTQPGINWLTLTGLFLLCNRFHPPCHLCHKVTNLANICNHLKGSNDGPVVLFLFRTINHSSAITLWMGRCKGCNKWSIVLLKSIHFSFSHRYTSTWPAIHGVKNSY